MYKYVLPYTCNRKLERRQSMKNLNVYDIEAEDIWKIAEENDVTIAEVVEALMNAVKDWGIDLTKYL